MDTKKRRGLFIKYQFLFVERTKDKIACGNSFQHTISSNNTQRQAVNISPHRVKVSGAKRLALFLAPPGAKSCTEGSTQQEVKPRIQAILNIGRSIV